MVFDPYIWSKEKIITLTQKIKGINNDGLTPSPGQIWSIKKLLVLDYYVGGFVKIIRSHPKFDSWYYVDTNCGSGLIDFEESDLKNEHFPGSPLIPAFRNSKTPFTEYYFSDIDKNAISSLSTRLGKLQPLVGNRSYTPKVRDFEHTVELIENMNRFGNAFLIFVDPTGFTEIHWDLMERLLSIDTADIFFTFMTWTIALNKKNAENDASYREGLNEFFGNENWVDCTTGDDLLQQYLTQIQSHKKYVFDIPVFQTGKRKLYDIIIATRSGGAKSIIEDVESIMDVTTTEMIRQAMRVATNKSQDLTSFFKN